MDSLRDIFTAIGAFALLVFGYIGFGKKKEAPKADVLDQKAEDIQVELDGINKKMEELKAEDMTDSEAVEYWKKNQ